MARANKVEVEIVATDEASPKIDKLEAKIDGLEADEARVTIIANTDRLEAQLRAAKSKLDGLDGDEATVQARLVGTIEKDLDDARRLFNQLDGKTGTVKLRADTSQLDAAKTKISGLVDEAGKLPGIMGEVAGLMGGGGAIAGGAAAIGAGLIAAAKGAADTALEAQTIADLTGASVENASRLLVLSRQAGIEYGDVADIVGQVNQVLNQTPEIVKQLGINLADGRDGVERIVQIVELLNDKTFDVQQRALIMGQLFGEQGVRQVQKLLTIIGGDLRKSMEDLPDALVTTDADVKRAREFNAMWAEMSQHVQAVVLVVGESLIPTLNDAAAIVRIINEGLGAVPGNLEDDLVKLATTSLPGMFRMFYQKSIGDLLADDEPTKTWVDRQVEIISEAVDAAITAGEAERAALAAQEPSREAANRQMETYVGWLERAGEAADQQASLVAAAERHADAIARVNVEHERVDRVRDLERESSTVDTLADDYLKLHEAISGEQSFLRLQETFLRAQERIAEGELSWRETKLLILDAQDEALTYLATLEDVPVEVLTNITALIDDQQFDKANAIIAGLKQGVEVPLSFKVDDRVLAALKSGASADRLEALSTSTRPTVAVPGTTVQNITVISTNGTPDSTAQLGSIYISRNGTRTGP